MIVRASEIRQALKDSVYGRSGKNVHAMNSQMEWHRIMGIAVRRGLTYGHAMNGKWFVIHAWNEQ